MPVVRIPEDLYRRLQTHGEAFVDTPASVIEKLLNFYEGAKMGCSPTVQSPTPTVEDSGYLLLAQQQWLQFHCTHSVGLTALYCRGTGGPMRSVPLGATVFCAMTGEVPHRVHLYGTFAGWEEMTRQAAWGTYNQRLGAATAEDWDELLNHIPSLATSSTVGLIRISNVVVPAAPIDLDTIAVELRRGAMKGRRLTSKEVGRILSQI